ncbi:hypothetical protein LWI29_012375 [Acer saccharum]|uniref:Kinesin-like protein n=1 Tax=Acer saccharum TaxID=4024 RepID=A0AA39VFG5_ACESA|nr:hypothetical protein LWI29_012375 [Acer saccharum]
MDNSDADADTVDSVLCVSGSRLIKSGFLTTDFTDGLVTFVNAGGGSLKKEGEFNVSVESDRCFEGGDVLRTDETIIDGGDMLSIYQSARFGNFSYRFHNLSPGDYLVDLHFAEIVNSNGPKGMRVFDVFMQEEKASKNSCCYYWTGSFFQALFDKFFIWVKKKWQVLSEVDIYSIVGANKPLQVVDVKVSVGKDGIILIRFDGICGSPIINGICIKHATNLPESQLEHGFLMCNNCGTEVEISSTQQKIIRMKSTLKYEKKIEELRIHCQLKTDECYEAWMSLTAANENLERVTVDLDNRSFQKLCLDQAIVKQAAEFRDLSSRYERDKRLWGIAIDELGRKIETMKEEQCQLSCEAHECVDSIPELNKMVYVVQALGNIRVFCRCRPLSKGEVSAGCATVVDFSAIKDGELGLLASGSSKKFFKFDRVYTPKDDQGEVFADASPMVISVLDGYNVCIFAYGQTGSGKTFTMEGTEKNRGVNYRTLEQLFRTAEERKETYTYNIFVSVLEVYNEQIRDLLATSPTSKKLEIRQASEGVHHVPGITEAKVENIKGVWDVLQAGSNARAVGSNNVNEHSSRSHCMLCIMVKAKNLINGECTKSKLWLVDLAGSERLAKTEAQGERLKEAQNINRSLSALGDVISSLATKSSHIPYRNSKLTHLLQDSLEQDVSETLSSLNFATRVRGVELGPAKKHTDTGEIQKLKLMVKELENRLKEREQAESVTQHKVKELENTLKERTQEFEVHSGILQQKIVELELKLRQQGALCSAEKFRSTPLNPRISRVENIHDMDPPSLRCLNSNEGNQTMGSSDLLKGTDSLRELRRKRQSQSKGTENNFLLSASFLEKKSVVSSETSKARHVDPSKAFARITRSAKPVSCNQRGSSNNKTNRDQVIGSKEGSNRLKLWLR